MDFSQIFKAQKALSALYPTPPPHLKSDAEGIRLGDILSTAPPQRTEHKPAAQLMEPLTAFAHRRENDASNSPHPPWKSTAVERALPEGRNTGWAQTSISQKLSSCICMCFYLHALVRGYKIRSFFKFSFLTESPAPKYKRCKPRGGLHLY